MTIDYDITPDDLVAFNLYCLHHVPSLKRGYTQFLNIMTTIAALALIVLLAMPFGSIPSLAALIVVLTFGYVLITQPFLRTRRIARRIHKLISKGHYAQSLGPQHISIAPDGYLHQSRFAEVKRFWHTIEAIRITESYIYIFVTPTCAEIVPKRAMTAANVWQDFAQQIEHYYSSAKQSQ